LADEVGHPDAVIGLIAGSKSLPFVFAREARRRGETVAAVAFEGETDPALEAEVAALEWVKVGQLSRMIRAFTSRGVQRCVMLGQIAPRNLFDVRPDLRAMSLLMRLKEKNAHTLFGAIGDELAKDGVQLVPAVPWLSAWMPGPGYVAGAPLPSKSMEDVRYGFAIAKEIARLEIGQVVVVKEGTTLAVEGFEGTDACLERGGRLAGKSGGAVAVKLARAGHDLRFDIPCIGPKTIEVCSQTGVRVLAFEAGMTLLIDREELEEKARNGSVSLVAASSLSA
jgi:DUF1009 family protein